MSIFNVNQLDNAYGITQVDMYLGARLAGLAADGRVTPC